MPPWDRQAGLPAPIPPCALRKPPSATRLIEFGFSSVHVSSPEATSWPLLCKSNILFHASVVVFCLFPGVRPCLFPMFPSLPFFRAGVNHVCANCRQIIFVPKTLSFRADGGRFPSTFSFAVLPPSDPESIPDSFDASVFSPGLPLL